MSAGLRDRFWVKVDKRGDCWVWSGATDGRYGIFKVLGRNKKAHRVSFEWANELIPAGMQVDHMCWNTLCVNPQHLRLASQSENNQNRSGPMTNSKSGVRGVFWSAPHKKWRAQAGLNGKNVYLGGYETAQEATAVVEAWRRENMPYSLKDHNT